MKRLFLSLIVLALVATSADACHLGLRQRLSSRFNLKVKTVTRTTTSGGCTTGGCSLR